MEQKKVYQISSSLKDGILEIILTGEEEVHTFEKMKKDIDEIIIKNNVKNVLIDCCLLEGRLGIAETYERVRSYAPEIYKTNIAIVDLPENAYYQKFHETTALNAGMKLKCFTDIDAARAWLKSKKKKS